MTPSSYPPNIMCSISVTNNFLRRSYGLMQSQTSLVGPFACVHQMLPFQLHTRGSRSSTQKTRTFEFLSGCREHHLILLHLTTPICCFTFLLQSAPHKCDTFRYSIKRGLKCHLWTSQTSSSSKCYQPSINRHMVAFFFLKCDQTRTDVI